MLSIDSITIPLADDLHVHLREGDLATQITPLVRKGGVGRVMVMPNLKVPIITSEMALAYQKTLQKIDPNVEYLMSLYLTQSLTPSELILASSKGVKNVKLYPAGVTTNSSAGVVSLHQFYPLFEVMQQENMILNVHGEVQSNYEKNICILNAEQQFLPFLSDIVKNFPRLRIVLEHITTAAAVEEILRLPKNVAATITAHHLQLCVDDWAGKNHNFCKPVAKFPADTQALKKAATSGNPQFFLGSDSAPHVRATKETSCACAGVFTAPFLLPYYAKTFDSMGKLDMLKDFSSTFGAQFYAIKQQTKMITLVRQQNIIPDEIVGIVPFQAGQDIEWQIVEG